MLDYIIAFFLILQIASINNNKILFSSISCFKFYTRLFIFIINVYLNVVVFELIIIKLFSDGFVVFIFTLSELINHTF